MAAAAPSPLARSVEKINGAKLIRLVIDGGTTVLRNVFDRYHPPADLAAGLNANYSILSYLFKRSILNKRHWDLLFPPGGATADSKTFDINLLFLLLTKICGLSPPLSGWHKPPPPSDLTLEANITRIKLFHNELYGHMTSSGIQTALFNIKWQEISAVLVSLGLDQADIDRLKAERWGEENSLDVAHDWADSVSSINVAAAAAHSPLASSVEKTNGTKLIRLVIDGGTTVLRNVFDRYHPPADLAAGLNANYSILSYLFKRSILNKRHWDLLFPPGGATADSKTFDINLLFLLLTKICGLSPPLSGWHKPPPPSDLTLEANITRIKLFHNELYGHMTSSGIQTALFDIKWQEISAVLVSLGLDQADIDWLKAERWGEENSLDVAHDWADSVSSINVAAAAHSPLASSVEKTNGTKLIRLVIDGGTTVLRNVFDRYHPPADLAAGLKANYSILSYLFKRSILNKRHWDLLFPPGGATADSKTFDINLLFLLLTKICGLSPPLSGWHKPPPPSDLTLEANITRIKLFHNELYSHTTSLGVQTALFNFKWQEISAVLVSLGLDQADIDRLKAECWGEEDYRHVQHDLADTLEDIKTRSKNTIQYSAMTQQKIEEVDQTGLELHELLQDPISKQEEINNIQTKTQETVKEVRLTQPDDPETLQDSNSKMDEVLDRSAPKRGRELPPNSPQPHEPKTCAMDSGDEPIKACRLDEPETYSNNRVAAKSHFVYPTTTLEVTLLGDEWASLTGGLTTFNRELAINLAAQPNVEVKFFVPEGSCTDEHKKTAKKYGVNVVEAKKLPGYDPPDWLIGPQPNLSMHVVIGHGVKLGRQAQVLKGLPSDNRKWVQVVHTAPEQLGMFKKLPEAISKAGSKHENEVDLCKRADLVVPVGPKLAEAYSSYLRSKGDQNTFVITPGLFKEFADLKQDHNDSSEFKVLLCGRGDSEDFELKGYDIGAEAFADEELKGKPYRLLSVGAPDRKEDEVARKFLEHGIAKEQLTVRKFVQSRDKMKELFREVDLAIMPSRTEGFGLIALEALSASLPILVSSNSGFARALRNLQSNTLCIVDSKEPKDWAKAIKAIRERHGEELQEIRKLRECYGKKYSWEKQCKDLVEKMRNMFRESGTCSPVWPLK